MATTCRIVAVMIASGVLAGCGAESSPVPAAGVGLQPARSPKEATSEGAHPGGLLYVADIDGQPGLGQILVYKAGKNDPPLIRTITNGAGRPLGMWVDKKNVLYVANYPNKLPSSITEFKPNGTAPFFTIANFKGLPESVAVDDHRNVFVNESYQNEGFVQEFAPGTSSAERTIDTGVGGYDLQPGNMAFDPSGDLIVAEQADLKLQIVEIARGSWAVAPMNLDLEGNGIIGPGMGIDKAGNIYVASSSSATVSVFLPGATEPSRTISPVAAYGYMYVTPQGAVYEASGEYTVTEIGAGSNEPTVTFSCNCSAQGVAVSR